MAGVVAALSVVSDLARGIRRVRRCARAPGVGRLKAEGARADCERVNGSGYPAGIGGAELDTAGLAMFAMRHGLAARAGAALTP